MTNGGEHHEADEHPYGTPIKALTTPKVLNHVQSEESGSKFDASKDHCRHSICKVSKSDVSLSCLRHTKRVLNSNTCRDGGAIVEEVICDGKLLKRL